MKCILVIVAIAASSLASVPLAAQTEAPRVARLGLLSDYEKFGPPASPSDWLEAFRAGLRELGYVEGKNIVLDFFYANGDPEKLAHMAAELAAMKVNVIVAASTTAAKAAKDATHTIPIVFWGAEPISSGLVANLDHPGENLTGVTANEEQQTEFLAMLKEVVPDLKRVAILFNRSYAPVPGLLKNAESGARALGLSTQLVEVAAPNDLPGAFEAMKREGSRAVLVLNHGMFFRERAKLATLAIENGIAVSSPYLPNAEAGVLVAHEADFDQVWRLNARYVDKILKGTNPGDLPVQKASFRYAINLKTAKALGLTIPQSVLNRAALVIPNSGDEANQASAPNQAEQEVAFVVKEIKQLEGERSRNLVNGDVDKQDLLLAPEFVEVSAAGQVRTKAENIQGMKSGQTHWEAFDLSDLDVHVYGETAVVTGRLSRKGTSAGRDLSGQSRYTRYYVRRQGRWQAIFQHGIPIGDADNASAPGQTRTTTAESDSGPDAQAVLARTEELNQAFLHGDIATLERIITDDCLQITQNGSRTKAEWLEPYRTGASRFESIKPPEWRRIRLYGNVAVVTSAAEIAMVVQGERRPSRFFNTRTWVKRSSQWYLVLAQNTNRAEQTAAQLTTPSGNLDAGETNSLTAGQKEEAPPRASSVEQVILALEDQNSVRPGERIQSEQERRARLADDYFAINGSGQIFSKAEGLDLYSSGRLKIESREFADLKVRVFGDTAVVTGTQRWRGQQEGQQRIGELRYTRVWVKRQGQWQVVSWQGTPILQQNSAAPSALTRSQGTPEDEAAIRKIVAEGADAWNRHDAKALAAHTSEDHDHINVNGAWRNGRAETEKALTAALATTRNNVSSSVAKIRFVTPDVAVVIVRREYTNDKETRKAISTSVFHKKNGEWWNEAFQTTLIQSREEAVAQAARASSPMAQTEPKVITPANSKTDFFGDVAAIRKMVADSVDAWNRRDPKAETTHGSENHDHINVIGEWRQGKAETENAMTAALATTRNNISRSIAKIRFITPDVAVVITRNEYTNDKETLKAISTSVLHKINGEWWNEAFQNTYVQPAADQTSDKTGSERVAEQEVLALEEQMEALQRSNSEARTALWAEDLIYIGNNGVAHDKTSLARAISAGEVKTESLEVTDRKVRIYGDTAVVTAMQHEKASYHGREARDVVQRYTRVWARSNAKWQAVSFQATRITAP